MAGLTILRVVSNDQIRQEEEKRARAEMEARQNQPVILGMAAYLRMCWDVAKQAKDPIEKNMLKAKRQRDGVYEPDKLAAIRQQGGSEIFMRLTEVKCRSAEAWIRDILLDAGAPPWDLQPTPIPAIDPQRDMELKNLVVQRLLDFLRNSGQAPTPEDTRELEEIALQEYRFKLLQVAQNRADRMSDKIKDQFAEGGWYDAFDDFVTDLVTYPAAFLKGPVVRRQVTLDWVQDQFGMQVVPKERLAPEYERVDPFRIYPEPGISDVNDGYIFEHHPLSRSELAALIGVPGYDEEAIRALLDSPTRNSWFFDDIELTKNELERKYYSWNSPTAIYDALEFWGNISGKMLREWGMTEEQVPDTSREYAANVWLIGNFVIKAVLNQDPLGEKPYAKASFFKIPGAFWGQGIPEMIEDVQNVCNASARALVNNMGLASGPQVGVNIDRLAPNEDITQLYPWKVWQTVNDPLGSSAAPLQFFQPDDRSGVLMAVYEKFSRLADEHSGIPAYVSGDISVTGAGRTSSGLSMLMGAAGKGIRQVISHIDNEVIKVIVQRQFVYNMRYDEDESIKGDVIVVPRGTVNLAVKETVNVRRIEFLQATANPIDAEIVGKDGRSAILREVAKGLQMPVDEIIPTREKAAFSARMEAKMAALAPPAPVPGAEMPGQTNQPAPVSTFPDGSPRGGQAGNLVSNMQTGRA